MAVGADDVTGGSGSHRVRDDPIGRLAHKETLIRRKDKEKRIFG